jgi:uncharacterized membrane protein
VENKKNNLAEALKLSEVKISRFLTKLKDLKKELIICKKIKEQLAT